MVIHCLFGMRDSTFSPELLVAWDENEVRDNQEGWEGDCQETLKSFEGEFARHAYIDIRVEGRKLAEQVWGSAISGLIRPAVKEKKHE